MESKQNLMTPAPPAGDVCPTCDSRGYVRRDFENRQGYVVDNCPDCKGTGKIADPILVLGDGVTYNKERGAVEVWGGGGGAEPLAERTSAGVPLYGQFEDVKAPTPAQPDPRENGTLCDRCGERYKVDFMLPDEVWRRVVRRSHLLCGSCVVVALENLGFDAYQLEKIP